MSQLDRRQALRLFAALGATGVAAPVLAACSGGGADSNDNEPVVVHTGPPIKIGMIVPQTGALKPFGDDMANGFQLYLKQSGNKLGGRPVNLITVDEGETAETSKAAAERLVKQEKVLAVTGVVNSDGMVAMKDTIEKGQTPLVGSNASPVNIGGVYIWRTSFIPTEPSAALGRWVAEHANGKVAVVAGNYPGNKDEVKGFTDAFTGANGQLVSAPTYTPLSRVDFKDTLDAVKSSGARALFCFYTGAAAVQFVKQLKTVGLPDDFQVYAPGSLTEGAQLKQQGDAANKIYTAMNYSPDLDNPTNRRFIADYQKAYNNAIPSSYAVASYDAAMVLDKSLDELNEEEITPQVLNAALGRLGQVDSPRGSWQFTANRAPLQKWYLRQVRRDGKVLSNVLTAELTTLG